MADRSVKTRSARIDIPSVNPPEPVQGCDPTVPGPIVQPEPDAPGWLGRWVRRMFGGGQ